MKCHATVVVRRVDPTAQPQIDQHARRKQLVEARRQRPRPLRLCVPLAEAVRVGRPVDDPAPPHIEQRFLTGRQSCKFGEYAQAVEVDAGRLRLGRRRDRALVRIGKRHLLDRNIDRADARCPVRLRWRRGGQHPIVGKEALLDRVGNVRRREPFAEQFHDGGDELLLKPRLMQSVSHLLRADPAASPQLQRLGRTGRLEGGFHHRAELVAVVARALGLRLRVVLRDIWLIPLRDCFGLLFWAWSYASDTVVWRGERFRLERGHLVRVQN